jgi:hypothetical protein
MSNPTVTLGRKLSLEFDRIAAENERLRHGLALIVRESEQFPDEDGIGAGTMARNILQAGDAA